MEADDFDAWFAEVEAGQDLIITRDGRPVVMFSRYTAPTASGTPGAEKELPSKGPEFVELLPEDDSQTPEGGD